MNYYKTFCIFFMSFVMFIFICSHSIGADINNELVMYDGMSINAVNKNGKISIKAQDQLNREYYWNGYQTDVKLLAREKRWYGNFGAYSPGGGSKFHVVVEEGHQYFCSKAEALEWLGLVNKLYLYDYVYTADGLVVGWYAQSDPKSHLDALLVNVWQIYINGKAPSDLDGAKDTLVTVNFSNVKEKSIDSQSTFVASKPQRINGRWYSGKALDLLRGSPVEASSELVEKAIASGEKGEKNGYTFYYLMEEGVFWVMLDDNSRVVLVGK